ncbi:uncharacterized protein TNCV_475401 [Trichonephila clavipes]|nr:uncharacterized protein TNCV_475401 [Trichonephila clavipes]
MALRRFRRQYEHLSQFEWGRIIGKMEAEWSARRVARQLGRSDCVQTRLSSLLRESRFNLSSDDNRVREWRPHGECLNPAFVLQRYTAPTAGLMPADGVSRDSHCASTDNTFSITDRSKEKVDYGSNSILRVNKNIACPVWSRIFLLEYG